MAEARRTLPPDWNGRIALPAIVAPMFMISVPDLVVECCRSGVIGAFPSLNQRDSAGYESWLSGIETRLTRHEEASGTRAAPFGVNLTLRRNDARLAEDLAITVAHRVSLVLTSLGVSAEVVRRIQDYGGIVLHDVVNQRHAEKAAEAGVDGLILVCAGAGGHAGRLNPFAFLAQVRRWFDRVVVLGGGLSDGRQIAAAELLGADLASLGTRFIATRESGAPGGYKQMILEADADDIAYTAALTGVGASFLRASLRDWGIDPDRPGGGEIDMASRSVRHGERTGKTWRDVWSAGQGVGTIDDVPPAAALCRRLIEEYESVLV